MLPPDERERIRRAYYIEKKSIVRIAQEEGHCRETIRKALAAEPHKPYLMKEERPAPIFKPHQARVEDLLVQNDTLPRKQRYTAHRIFEIIRSEGYSGCESRVRKHVQQWNYVHQAPDLFLPLEFEPGQDAQCDWGEATAVIAGVRQTVQVFVMRLCYSRKTFVMTFPSQVQESFFFGHVQAFTHFGGVPARISYDNLATAVKIAFDKGRRRQENRTFVAFRSHYLFESHFCTPSQGHEKGQVEHGVGFSRRNFLVPIPEAASFEDLNGFLLQECNTHDKHRIHRQTLTVGQAWEQERAFLQPLPAFAFDCCERFTARLTPYSQVTFETNRYSVPVSRARREVSVKAYPFHIEILDQAAEIARHARCYEREQDIFEPLHYLPLLEQRPGAFDYAKPIKRWRKEWPPAYHRMLGVLREKWPEGRGVQEFVRVLHLHQDYPAALIQQAVEQALSIGCVHLDGVLHCLHQLTDPKQGPTRLDLSDRPHLDAIGNQPVDLSRYEQLLKQSW